MHARAVRMLLWATVLWGLSFPLVKSIALLCETLVPAGSTWFQASLMGVVRFVGAALLLLALSWQTLRQFSRLELWQGLGLGVFAGGGILFQMDGLAHTHASTSAFLTQAYCVLVPVIVAIRDRVPPGPRLVLAVILILAGVAILANFNPKTFHLGRGELETLVSACFFAGQIVWLERPLFARNNVNHFSLVMFAVMAVISAPVLLLTTPSWSAPLVAYADWRVITLTLALTLICTVAPYVLMNKWQPHVTSSEASIIYCVEPLVASAFALFLPAVISSAVRISYPNETLAGNLLIGGSLIIAANLLLQLKNKDGKSS